MNRRNFLGLAAAADPLRFINRKAGLHPFRTRDAGQRPHDGHETIQTGDGVLIPHFPGL